MALTNPTRLVNVQRLARFKDKLDLVYAKEADMPGLATVAEVQAIVHDETIIIDE
jgi:hypothetical protein